jgi:hypothetical protein
MKIDENFLYNGAIFNMVTINTILHKKSKRIFIYFSHLFSPYWRAGGFHGSAGGLLRAKHPPAADNFALKCLAYESLQRVQESHCEPEPIDTNSFIIILLF